LEVARSSIVTATGTLLDELPRVCASLPDFLAGQRWFGGKGRPIASTAIADHASLDDVEAALLAMIDVVYVDGDHERYFVPLLAAAGDRAAGGAAIARTGESVVVDALTDPGFCRSMLATLARGPELTTELGGQILFRPRSRLAGFAAHHRSVSVRFSTAEQSNSSVFFDQKFILKAFRRLQEGPNPELEVLAFLTNHTDFAHVPELAGVIEYRAPDGGRLALGVLQDFVANEGDGWSHTLRELERLSSGEEATAGLASGYLASTTDLGHVTADLHLAFASAPHVADFAPTPITREDVLEWERAIAGRVKRMFIRLDQHFAAHPEAMRGLDMIPTLPHLRDTVDGLMWLADGTLTKTRHHGDYHLGQVLKTADSWVVIDFEGEPLRPIAERRARHTPLKDVAGMLRSLSYAAAVAARERPLSTGSSPRAAFGSRLRTWERRARRAFLDAYLGKARSAGATFLPRSRAGVRSVLAALELEKAVYELEYELDNRPDWVAIPLRALAGS